MRFEDIPLGHSFMSGKIHCIKIGLGIKSFKDEYASDHCCNAINLDKMHLVTYCEANKYVEYLGLNKDDLLAAQKFLQSDKAKATLCDDSLMKSKYVVHRGLVECIKDEEAEQELEESLMQKIEEVAEACGPELKVVGNTGVSIDAALDAIAFLSDSINKTSTLSIPPQTQSAESRHYLDKIRIETIRRAAEDILNICNKFM